MADVGNSKSFQDFVGAVMVNTTQIAVLNRNIEDFTKRLEGFPTRSDVRVIAVEEIDKFYRRRLAAQSVIIPLVVAVATIIANGFIEYLTKN
jgi:hypothetical protein